MHYDLDFAAPLAYWHKPLDGRGDHAGPVGRRHRASASPSACSARSRAPAARPQRLGVAGAYVEAIRNTPLLVQIFIVYFGLASRRHQVRRVHGGDRGAGHQRRRLHGGDRARRDRVGPAQPAGGRRVPGARAAGRCCGTWCLPPAIERVWPALTSQYVLLMLASSITSQISTEELTAVANRVQSDTFRSVETYLVVAAALSRAVAA